MIEIRLLGQFDVRVEGAPVEIPSRPAQSLLAYLVLTAGKAHRREKLAGMLWPDSDESNARSNLRHALWRVRKAVGQDFIEADNIQIGLGNRDGLWVDALEVSRLDLKAGVDELGQALRLYGGELLPGFYEDWAVLEREGLRSRFEAGMNALIEQLIASADWPQVVEWSERWIALGQTPEAAFRALMQAKAALGDMAGVALTYERCKTLLNEQLGVEPSQGTVRLFEDLQAGLVPSAGRPIQHSVAPASGVGHLIDQWIENGEEILDLASLAIVNAAREVLNLRDERADIVLRSVLSYGVEVEPWLARFESASSATEAIERLLSDRRPGPDIRVRAVGALGALHSDRSQSILQKIILSDSVPRVRREAAAALQLDGTTETIARKLADEFTQTNEPAAATALAALADRGIEVRGLRPIPGIQLKLALFRLRWPRWRAAFWVKVWRGALGAAGGLGIHGAATPAYMALARPEVFQEATQFITLPGWVLSGMVIGLVVGFIQGFVTPALLGLVEIMMPGELSDRQRAIVGGISGLAHTGYLTVFALVGLLSPPSVPAVYFPANLMFGLVLGAALAWLVPAGPELKGSGRPKSALVQVLAGVSLVTAMYVLVVYQNEALETIPSRIVYAVLLVGGFGLAQMGFRREENRGEE